MKLLAISGSARRASVNTAMLRALGRFLPDGVGYGLFDGVGDLPVFSPDLERGPLPASASTFKQAVAAADGLLIACPEYVRSIPGGLKNAIDWLVSGDEVIAKPIALVHVSGRGDDMLAALRVVLATVSVNFREDIFLRIPVRAKPAEDVDDILSRPDIRLRVDAFLSDFVRHCATVEAAR